MKGFISFIRKQGIVGFATGFIVGGSVTKVVTAFVNDLVNPLLGLVLGFTKDLSASSFKIGEAEIKWGDFLVNLIDFFVLAFVVYMGFKLLRLDRLDHKD